MDVCFICDNVPTCPIKLDCDHKFCLHCLLPWCRWALMKTMLICPMCDEEVFTMDVGNRILTPIEARLLVWTYSFMYATCPQQTPLPKDQVTGQIDARIAQVAARPDADDDGIVMLDLGRAWMKEEMGLDSEVDMLKMVKDFVNENYCWLWSCSFKNLM